MLLALTAALRWAHGLAPRAAWLALPESGAALLGQAECQGEAGVELAVGEGPQAVPPVQLVLRAGQQAAAEVAPPAGAAAKEGVLRLPLEARLGRSAVFQARTVAMVQLKQAWDGVGGAQICRQRSSNQS